MLENVDVGARCLDKRKKLLGLTLSRLTSWTADADLGQAYSHASGRRVLRPSG